MSIGKTVAFALVAGSVAVGGTAIARNTGVLDIGGVQFASQEHEEAREYGARSDKMLSMEQIMKRVTERGYSDVREIEREDGGRYEVKARNADGRWIELYIDGGTGEILKEESE